MPRHFNNRSYKEIVAFLLAHGFSKVNTVGDDEIYVRPGHRYTVKVTMGRKSTPIGTMMQIRKMARLCGVEPKEWLVWWIENGFGE